MGNTTLRVLATLLGILGALSAAAAAVFGALWILDQGPTAGLRSLLAAIGLGIIALGSFVGRRVLIIAAGRRQAFGAG
jgi:hypothetical protein